MFLHCALAVLGFLAASVYAEQIPGHLRTCQINGGTDCCDNYFAKLSGEQELCITELHKLEAAIDKSIGDQNARIARNKKVLKESNSDWQDEHDKMRGIAFIDEAHHKYGRRHLFRRRRKEDPKCSCVEGNDKCNCVDQCKILRNHCHAMYKSTKLDGVQRWERLESIAKQQESRIRSIDEVQRRMREVQEPYGQM